MLAPFALLRTAGLPFDALTALTLPGTSAAIGRARRARRAMAAEREQLEAALYALIPGLKAADRAPALALRRDIHNGRSHLARPATAAIRAQLPAEDGAALDTWLAAAARLAEARQWVRQYGDDEIHRHLRPALRTTTTGEDFRRPLALAAPQLLAKLLSAPAGDSGIRATRTERSLISYLMRAAAKTSPFSTFMYTSVVDLSAGAGPEPCRRTSRSTLNRGLVDALRRAARGCCGDPEHARLVKNPAITWTSSGLESMAPTRGAHDGRVLRLARPVRATLPHPVARAVAGLPAEFGAAELAAVLDEDTPVRALIDQLLSIGVLAAAPWTDAFDERPDTPVKESNCPRAGELDARLSVMARRATQLAGQTASERLGTLAGIRAGAERAARDLGIELGETLRTPVTEDGYAHHSGHPVPELSPLLREVAAVVADRVEEHPHHAALRQQFVDLYGEGGTCYDTIEFLRHAASGLSPDTIPIPGAVASARPPVPVTAMLQLSPDMAVLNALYPGCGSLSARRARGDTDLTNALRDWLPRVTSPAEPVDVIVSGDCNELQAHPLLTDRVLAGPLEPSLHPATLSWRDVILRHDAEHGRITVEADGRAIAPVYLGATVPHPGWGPTYWLLLLSNPWRPRPLRAPPPPKDAATIGFHERRTIGRVLLRRRTWWVPTARIRQRWLRGAGAQRAFDTALDCADLGLPDQFFLTPYGTVPATTARHRKPFWIDVGNPFLLDCLEHLIGDTSWARVVEPLPDGPTGRRQVSELHVEMLV
ncbi:hypothetical protein [Paractinoplanes brasiliensis]|uniref:Lantibiotic biosynthesis dehydratase-like protein n=1 Tax=Paractinoplanes brasiliensis TaxID=52695 RepID=A0A4V3C7B1_9ACTN|nr:hypothetical protein [Actinoplanes brasiliensis]TDO36948.1 hypothetical protein C8E87_0538 [Actinoplanes brasiliensis]GID30470.1 hypothetical protein Abr02nite_54530 [Actinoplanes brasiliensis]